MNFDFKKILPHLIVVAIFFMLTFVYFLPLFQGKAMVQHDIAQWQGAAKKLLISEMKRKPNRFGPTACLAACLHFKFQLYIRAIY